MKGPRLTNTQSRGMKDETTRCATYTPCLVKEPRGYAIASSERARLMAGDRFLFRDVGISPVVAELLFVSITLLLAVLIAASLFGFIPVFEDEEPVPEILKITAISHTNAKGDFKYSGIIQLKNVGSASIDTMAHGMYVYINGKKIHAVVEILKASEFIPTVHDGVRLLYGNGPLDDFWRPGSIGFLDLKDKLIVSESHVVIEVYHRETGEIVSRSEIYAPKVFF